MRTAEICSTLQPEESVDTAVLWPEESVDWKRLLCFAKQSSTSCYFYIYGSKKGNNENGIYCAGYGWFFAIYHFNLSANDLSNCKKKL